MFNEKPITEGAVWGSRGPTNLQVCVSALKRADWKASSCISSGWNGMGGSHTRTEDNSSRLISHHALSASTHVRQLERRSSTAALPLPSILSSQRVDSPSFSPLLVSACRHRYRQWSTRVWCVDRFTVFSKVFS